MRMATTLFSALLCLVVSVIAFDRCTARLSRAEILSDDEPAKKSDDEPAKKKDSQGKGSARDDAPPVVTHHEARIGGRSVSYTVTAGLMPIKDENDKTEAHIFYIAYTLDEAGSIGKRPLMFSFNGGPGSSSVWLHLGALGPKRVKLPGDASFPAPPYQLVDNEDSWLDQTDLVFIDPVGTGYSRPERPEMGKKFFGMRGDVRSVGEFIRMYLTRNERWASPLFLVGESYGTTRAAGLSEFLVDRGVAFNGIVLVSSALNFQTFMFGKGNDLPYILYVPGFTATAWYHKKLSADLQADLHKALAESERWAANDYALALGKGDRLSPEERRVVVEALARFTGLEKTYLEGSNLRVTNSAFCRELLKSERQAVGRLDSRYKGDLGLAFNEAPSFDPSMAAVMAPYTSMINQYVRSELGYKSDAIYHVLGTGVGAWDWGSAEEGYPDTTEALRMALAKNPNMKLFVASGYFDLATPYTATQYTIEHLGLDPASRRNVCLEEYEAGHMMYVHPESLAKLKSDVTSFIHRALGD
jgi:carboxypeptidase C (cathepsin A)